MDEKNVSIGMNMEGKNIIVAYLLWWFLGWAGVHRFYLGRTKSGITQLLLCVIGFATAIILIGYIFLIALGVWWLLDAYFTYQIVSEENLKNGVKHTTVSFTKSGSIQNELDQLEKLHSLYEKGVITQEQYEEKKAALI